MSGGPGAQGWEVQFHPAVRKDMARLSAPVRDRVFKAVRRVSSNPLPRDEGGYGRPLGNVGGRNLTGLLKIRLRDDGVRVVYRLVRDGGLMRVLVVGAREGDEVYELAARRDAREWPEG